MKETYSRREFTQTLAMLFTLFGAASTARAGIDTTKKKRRRGKPISTDGLTVEEAATVKLAIDLPTEEGWRVRHPLASDDWKRINIDPDTVAPCLHRQLVAAKAAPWGTPVLVRVLGDPVAVLHKAAYFAPGEPDDRGVPDELCSTLFEHWRLEYFGDGIRQVSPDNRSWMMHRLDGPPEWTGRERAWFDEWMEENDETKKGGINSGCGIAQDLMLSIYRYEKPEGFEPWLTNRERRILATFVQWLGTNCGQGFLHNVKRSGGLPL